MMDRSQLIRKRRIVSLLRKGGALWPYGRVRPDRIDDEAVMELGLLHLEFEDMSLLFDLYGDRRLRKVFRERLVPQGEYYRTLNWLLAILFFGIKRPDRYLDRYGNKN